MKSFLTILALALTALSAANSYAATCTVDLLNGRGKLLNSFTNYGYTKAEACIDAKRSCNDVINSGTYRAPILKCKKVVTRTCTSTLRNRRGGYITSRMGSATGYAGTGVKAKACGVAVSKCQTAKYTYGSRGSYCTKGSVGGPVVISPNPSRPRHGRNRGGRSPRRPGRGGGHHRY